MKNLFLISLVLLLALPTAYGIPSDTMKQIINCHKNLKEKTREGNKKFKECIGHYIVPELSDFSKKRIGMSLVEMSEISKMEDCSKDTIYNLKSLYKKGAKFVCFKAKVAGEDRDGFAVLKRPEKSKFFDEWKIFRIKYGHK